jgi:hypothetical protein
MKERLLRAWRWLTASPVRPEFPDFIDWAVRKALRFLEDGDEDKATLYLPVAFTEKKGR